MTVPKVPDVNYTLKCIYEARKEAFTFMIPTGIFTAENTVT